MENKIILVDNEHYCLTVIDSQVKSSTEFAIGLNFINKTEDKVFVLDSNRSYVNGLEIKELFFGERVEANSEVNLTYKVDLFPYRNLGIDEFTKVEVKFNVTDPNASYPDPLKSENMLTLYPMGEENYKPYTHKSKSTDVVLVDNEYVKITSIGFKSPESEADYEGIRVNLFVESKSDKSLLLSTDDEYVNGFKVSTYTNIELNPGHFIYNHIRWSKDSFSENGIEQAEKLEFKLAATLNNGTYSEPMFKESVVIDSFEEEEDEAPVKVDVVVDNDYLVGNWRSEEMNPDMFLLTLNADGTLAIKVPGDNGTGSWSLADGKVDLDIMGDKLSAGIEGGNLVFGGMELFKL